MGITEELAGYCSELSFKHLPDAVIDRVKYRFLDFIGVSFRGSRENSSQSMYRFIKQMNNNHQQGVVIGIKERASYLYAALANGTSSHAIELDDVHNESSLHPGVIVFPSALATGEMVNASGKRFIEGVVLGYEVMTRIGKALGPENSYRRGFHPTGICGVFGSAVAASKILRLPKEGIINAMGISGSQAAGSMEYLAQGAWTKKFHAGWGAYSGMIAALLANKGFRGPSTIIEGRDGFLHSYSNGSDSSKVLEGLGVSEFEILQTSVKPHACCRYMQPSIDGILKIVNENDLHPEDVEEIRLGILKAGFPLIAEPIDRKYDPQSIVDAQFSMPFGAAIALLYRRAGLDEFQLSKIRSEEVKKTMKKIKCLSDPELEKTFPKQWRANVEILTKDGKRFFLTIEYPKGDPENPLSWKEMIERFHDLTGRLMPKRQRTKIVGEVRALEDVRNLRKWSGLLLRKA
jgi:2-methylcitrate dehydratase PrpD